MIIDSDIIIGTYRQFDDYLNDGWLEGFNVTWPDYAYYRDDKNWYHSTYSYSTDEYYKNTLLVRMNYDFFNGYESTDVARRRLDSGTTYWAYNTATGFKFVYKPWDNDRRYIQWAILYITVHDLNSGQDFYHYYCNKYNLIIDGKQMVSTSGDNSDGKSVVLYTNNGVGSSGHTPGRILRFGDNGSGEGRYGFTPRGRCTCMFYGKFIPSSSNFQVSFAYNNWAYLSYVSNVSAMAFGYSNWNTPVAWGEGSRNYFPQNNTHTASLAPTAPTIAVQQSGKVSYRQNSITVSSSNAKYLMLSSMDSSLKSGNSFSYNLQNLPVSASSGAGIPATLTATASYWNPSNWVSTASTTVQYAPIGVTRNGISLSGEGQETVQIKFAKHTPYGQSGYFSHLELSGYRQSDNNNTHTYLISGNFSTQAVTIELKRDIVETGELSYNGTNIAIGGLNQFVLYCQPVCVINGQTIRDTSQRFSISYPDYALPPTGTQISTLSVDFPNRGDNTAILYKNRSGNCISNLCIYVDLDSELEEGQYIGLRVGSTLIGKYTTTSQQIGDSYRYKLQANRVGLTSNSIIQIDVYDENDESISASGSITSVLDIQIKEHNDYQAIRNGRIVNAPDIANMIYQTIDTLNNYRKILDSDRLSILDELYEKVQAEKGIGNRYYQTFIKDIIDLYVWIESNCTTYYNVDNELASPLNSTYLNEFIWESADTALKYNLNKSNPDSALALWVHEEDDLFEVED